jgi:hypothetical protein
MEAYGWVSYNRKTTRVRRELSQSCGGVRREARLDDDLWLTIWRGPVTLLQSVEDSAFS